jgi:hypothetical protein
VMLWRMRVRSLDLYETLRAYSLVAAPSLVQIWRVVKKANWALSRVLIQENLDCLAVYVWVLGQLYFSGNDF